MPNYAAADITRSRVCPTAPPCLCVGLVEGGKKALLAPLDKDTYFEAPSGLYTLDTKATPATLQRVQDILTARAQQRDAV